jgi:hypothetical protein
MTDRQTEISIEIISIIEIRIIRCH